MAISLPGLGSNLDVSTLVSKLMEVERQPLTTLQTRMSAYDAKVSAFGSLRSALSSFQSTMASLADVANLATVKATPGDTSLFAATADTTAIAGQYSVEVKQLARSQKLVANGIADATTSLGGGTITFDFGTIDGISTGGKYAGATFSTNGVASKSILIPPGASSLLDVRDAINAAKMGVTAAIINDGTATPHRLVLTNTATGEATSMRISVTGNGTDTPTALQNLLGQDPAGIQNLTESSAAADALVVIDGVDVYRPTNVISGAVPGVTLTLTKTNVGSPTTLAVATDTAGITANVNKFVSAYNALAKTIGDVTAYNPDTKVAAALTGDITVRNIQVELRRMLTQPAGAAGSTRTTLSQVGVTFQKDGTLAVDAAKLQDAVTNHLGDVKGLFSTIGSTSDALTSYSRATAATVAGTYAVSVTRLARQGTLTGTAAANTTIVAGTNDRLTVTLNGTTANVTLDAGSYTPDALAALLQEKVNKTQAFVELGASVKVTQTGGTLTMQSSLYGAQSAVAVTEPGGGDLFGGAVGVSGQDVAGTINGVAATGSGQTLVGGKGDASEGLAVRILGGVEGARGVITYQKGYATQLNEMLSKILGEDGVIATRTEGLATSKKTLQNQTDAFNRRLEATQARLFAQFSALDTTMNTMNNLSAYLTQQMYGNNG